MAGLDFKSELKKEQEDSDVVQYNTRIGLVLFFVYVLFYASFMVLSAFFPEVMGSPLIGGLNFSVVFGFFLIALALVLALIYMAICKKSKVGGPS